MEDLTGSTLKVQHAIALHCIVTPQPVADVIILGNCSVYDLDLYPILSIITRRILLISATSGLHDGS